MTFNSILISIYGKTTQTIIKKNTNLPLMSFCNGLFSFNGVDIKTQKKSLLVMGKFKCKRIDL